MQRIALTGSTGFVGRAVAAQAERCGIDCKKLVRIDTHDPKAVTGSLDNGASLRQLVEGCDTVLHLAGAIHARDRADYFKVNAEGTSNLLQAARAAGVKRFVHMSSLAAREPELSDYAASKAAGEAFVLEHSKLMDVLVLRPCAVYGPGDMATLPLIKSLLGPLAVVPGTPASRFSLIHVSDLAGIAIEACKNSLTGVIELDDTHGGYGWRDLAAVTRLHFGRPNALAFLPRPIASLIARAGRAGQAVGIPPLLTPGKVNELYHADWTASKPGLPRPHPILLEAGLLQAISWYRQHGHLRGGPEASKAALLT
jgi:nucleoside-diphosphate-sugar epimerase